MGHALGVFMETNASLYPPLSYGLGQDNNLIGGGDLCGLGVCPGKF